MINTQKAATAKCLTRLTETVPLLTFSSGKVCVLTRDREEEDIERRIAEVNVSLGPFQQQCNGLCRFLQQQQQEQERQQKGSEGEREGIGERRVVQEKGREGRRRRKDLKPTADHNKIGMTTAHEETSTHIQYLTKLCPSSSSSIFTHCSLSPSWFPLNQG